MQTITSALELKRAHTRPGVLPEIADRWSARAFSNQPLSDETVATLIEAAAWAPSAMNEQPWRFVVAHREDEAEYQRLADLLLPGNRLWADKAPLLMVLLAKQTYTANGKPNGSAAHDTGMATQNLLLQAAHMGIYGHVMGGFDKEKTSTDLGLDADYKPVTMLALGYPGDPESLEEPFRTRELTPRTRKSVEELIWK